MPATTATKSAPRAGGRPLLPKTARTLAKKAAAPPPPTAADAAAALASSTIVMVLERRKPSFRRKLAATDVVGDDDTEQGDRQLLHVSQDLLDRKLLKEIRREDGAVRRYLEGRAVSCSMLARGNWLLPLALTEEVDTEVDAYIERRTELVRILADEKYVEAKVEAKQRRGRHYKEADYPEASELKAAFAVNKRYNGFNVPAALKGLNDEIYQREVARVQVACQRAEVEIQQALAESAAELVEHLADALKPGEDGKPKVFRNTTVEKLQDFLATVDARNITNDAALAAMTSRARAMLNGVEADTLRKDESARERVQKGIASVGQQLRALAVTRSRQVARRGEEV